MRPDSNPVTCQWTAEELNDKTISFVPSRHGMGVRTTGQLLAAQVGDGLYIQVAVTRPNSQQTLYWLNQDEASRIERSRAESEIDFLLA